MKIASWNVNSLKVRSEQVCDWLSQNQPDVLALQETKLIDSAFPREIFAELGYEAAYHGQKTYNGVAFLSRLPVHAVEFTPALFPDQQARLIAITVNHTRLVNVYVPNGASLDSDKYQYKLAWLAALKKYLRTTLQQHKETVVMGDFNIAPSDIDVHDPLAWKDQVLTSKAERDALESLLKLGFTDAFRKMSPDSQAYSWWDYRQASFRRDLGLRIDLILTSHTLNSSITQCLIDKAPRKHERPSDHAPVLITLD